MVAPFRLRGLVTTLVGTLVLATLWLTSLTLLTARPTATDLLTEAGTQVLNPFLVGQGLGLSPPGYAALEAEARAHPGVALSLGVLKVRVLGRDVVGKSYPAVVELVYGRVAEAYYDGGAETAFNIPPQLMAALPTFGMFSPGNTRAGVPSLPGAPNLPQLPAFLQPFFTVVGLTPDTFTAAGHARLASLLPWFWVALAALAVLSVLLHPGERRLAGLLRGVVHGSWPVVLVLVGLWVLSRVYTATFAPYTGLLGTISGAFLPIYGGAFAVGLVGLIVTKALAAGGQRDQRTPAMVAAGAWWPRLPAAPSPARQTRGGGNLPPEYHRSAPPYVPGQQAAPPHIPGDAGWTVPYPPDLPDNADSQ